MKNVIHRIDGESISHPLDWKTSLIYFFSSVLLILLIQPRNFMVVLGGRLINPDSYMRLNRIHEAMQHGAWFGDVISRDASGAGMVLHWSHLMDALLWVLYMPLSIFLPQELALHWSSAIWGPLTVGVLGWACAWAIAPLVPKKDLILAPIGVVLSVPVISYGSLGVGTHHLLLVTLVVIVWGCAGRSLLNSYRHVALSGVVAGLSIWLSPEAMPYVLLGFAAILLVWLMRPDFETAFMPLIFGATFLALIVLAWLVDSPFQGMYAVQFDRLSIPFVVLALIVWAISGVPLIFTLLNTCIKNRHGWLIGVACFGALLWVYYFPQYLRGLHALMSPNQAKAFFTWIREMMSVSTLSDFMSFLLPGIFVSVFGVIYFVIFKNSLNRYWGLFIAGAAMMASLLTYQHIRFSIYLVVSSAMMLPWLMTIVSRLVVNEISLRWLRISLLFIALFLPTIGGFLVTSKEKLHLLNVAALDDKRCPVIQAKNLLKPYPNKVVLANVNHGPELLYQTNVKIVGSLYHSGIDGFMRLKQAWSTNQYERLPVEIKRAQIDLILICPNSLRTGLIDGQSPTLFDALNQTQRPSWLNLVGQSTTSEWLLYEVMK